jgi:hypothetical protein
MKNTVSFEIRFTNAHLQFLKDLDKNPQLLAQSYLEFQATHTSGDRFEHLPLSSQYQDVEPAYFTDTLESVTIELLPSQFQFIQHVQSHAPGWKLSKDLRTLLTTHAKATDQYDIFKDSKNNDKFSDWGADVDKNTDTVTSWTSTF